MKIEILKNLQLNEKSFVDEMRSFVNDKLCKTSSDTHIKEITEFARIAYSDYVNNIIKPTKNIKEYIKKIYDKNCLKESKGCHNIRTVYIIVEDKLVYTNGHYIVSIPLDYIPELKKYDHHTTLDENFNVVDVSFPKASLNCILEQIYNSELCKHTRVVDMDTYATDRYHLHTKFDDSDVVGFDFFYIRLLANNGDIKYSPPRDSSSVVAFECLDYNGVYFGIMPLLLKKNK